ncbi:hypothetical protein [Mycobacterium sp. 141]|uniref:hypothetical protein n=1 Tax=Mycobacterium sp. 141 TaxID=1120797 RepID=UPI000475F414|nr:hypothetical protein [Mycobacterium sp. 141]
MARHALASRRRVAPAVGAALLASVAVCFAAGGSAAEFTAAQSARSVVEGGMADGLRVVTPVLSKFSSAPSDEESGMAVVSPQVASRSRYRVVPVAVVPRFLPVGVAPERGLQVRTILTARAVSAAFPEIHEIGGVRPDALRWHPDGLALDVMIPNPGSADGIALGNAIVAYALKNADRFGLQDAIWRGTYYTPSGPQSSGYGHYDHVHLTTTGGGYPTGGEVYPR